MLAKALLDYPLMVPLLIKQAKCLLKLEYYEFAQKIAITCVELVPESFEAWILYSRTCFALK